MKIYMYENIYDKLMYWIKKTKEEISGFGTVRIEDKDIIVTDIFLCDQENTGSTSDIEADAINKLQYELIKSGKLNNDNDLKFWWHSHADMNVFWSTTDADTIKELGQQGYFLHGVFNRKEEYKVAFSKTIHDLVKIDAFVDDLELIITEQEDMPNELLEVAQIEAEITKLSDSIKTYSKKIEAIKAEYYVPFHKEWEQEFKDKVQEKKFVHNNWRDYNRRNANYNIPDYKPKQTNIEVVDSFNFCYWCGDTGLLDENDLCRECASTITKDDKEFLKQHYGDNKNE